MLLLGIILLMLLLQGVVCPVPTYDAQGPALLFLEEGEEVLSLGGASFLMGITPGECADVCTYLGLACPTDDDQECCDSFSYRMIDQLCYLKKRGYNASMEVKFNSEGWTSYSYWGETSSVFPGGQYTGGQPIIVRAARVPNRLYRHAYVSQGPNQLAISEGQTIKNSKGRNFLGRVTPKDCAHECDNTFQCDAFSYNPNQRQGKCYLKRSANVDRFVTVYNDDGWTYYWKESDYQSKCFCSCLTGYVCVMCDYAGGPGTCQEL